MLKIIFYKKNIKTAFLFYIQKFSKNKKIIDFRDLVTIKILKLKYLDCEKKLSSEQCSIFFRDLNRFIIN